MMNSDAEKKRLYMNAPDSTPKAGFNHWEKCVGWSGLFLIGRESYWHYVLADEVLYTL